MFQPPVETTISQMCRIGIKTVESGYMIHQGTLHGASVECKIMRVCE